MKLHTQISEWLKDYSNSSKLDCFVIGISGGIDSALTSALCAETGKKTVVISMPIHQAKDQLDRAHKHIEWLKNKYKNVQSYEFNLTEIFENFKSLFKQEHQLALANSRSRLRMVTLYHVASINRGLVVGTGNKVEDFGVGFFTKYGDGGVDLSPIADLTKTEVRNMAKELDIIEDILVAKPTDGLWEDNRSDEDQIGASYEELEWAMDNHNLPEELASERQTQVLAIYKKFHTENLHKMNPIPFFKKS